MAARPIRIEDEKKKTRGEIVCTRFHGLEREKIEAMARRSKVPLSVYIRGVMMDAVKRKVVVKVAP